MSEEQGTYHGSKVHSEYGVEMPYHVSDTEITQWHKDYDTAVRSAHRIPGTRLRHRWVTESSLAYLPPTNNYTVVYGQGGPGGNSHPGQSTHPYPGGGAGGGVYYHPKNQFTIKDLEAVKREMERQRLEQKRATQARIFAEKHDGQPYRKSKPRKKAHEIIAEERDRIFREYGIK